MQVKNLNHFITQQISIYASESRFKSTLISFLTLLNIDFGPLFMQPLQLDQTNAYVFSVQRT